MIVTGDIYIIQMLFSSIAGMALGIIASCIDALTDCVRSNKFHFTVRLITDISYIIFVALTIKLLAYQTCYGIFRMASMVILVFCIVITYKLTKKAVMHLTLLTIRAVLLPMRKIKQLILFTFSPILKCFVLIIVSISDIITNRRYTFYMKQKINNFDVNRVQK